MGALGLLGMHLEGYGCAGTERRRLRPGLPRARGRRLAACAASSPCRGRSRCSRSGAGAPRSRSSAWLPAMAAGEAIGCFGLTEPDAGSRPGGDAHARPPRRRRTGCSTAPRCGSPTARSPTSPSSGRAADETAAIRGFVVPTDTPGFTANDIHKKLSLRASVTAELVLEDVRAARRRRAARGRRRSAGPLSCLNEARYGILWGAVGAARRLLRVGARLRQGAEQFGKPIAGFQLTQRKLADMVVAVNKGRSLAPATSGA